MIPRTYPSIRDGADTKMVMHSLVDVTGLTRWVHYIPVKLVTPPIPKRNTYDPDGAVYAMDLVESTGLTAWKDYIPTFIDNTATTPWSTNAGGFIPLYVDDPAPVGDPPILDVPPSISGVPAVGATLTATSGNWTSVLPVSYAYRWLQNNTAIIGGNQPTYVVREGDYNASLRCVVTASNSAGETAAFSNQITIITP